MGSEDEGEKAARRTELDPLEEPVQPTGPSAVAVPGSLRPPMWLERIEPPTGRGERHRLDAAHGEVSLGRAATNDIRLHTPSASREHASIAGTAEGEWVLTPGVGKCVWIDGDETWEPVVLEEGMNIVLGRDHLRCALRPESGLERSAQPAAKGSVSGRGGRAEGLRRISASTRLIIVLASIGIGLIALAWLSR
ncbi:MAG: hypothetical protein CL908_27250 [Deltaproteobacteria bacterium]|nr:hypothetical protein [Deltaproteobacteria bacterium]